MFLALIFWAQSGWSYTVSGTTYTTDGSQSDVQNACNAAPDNGTVTVLIPNGTYSWTGTLTITHSLTLQGASAGGVIIQNNLSNGGMIEATSSANGNVNIYWLTINEVANNSGGLGYMLVVDRTEPSPYTVLIHDCTFNAGTIISYSVQCLANGIIFWNDTLACTPTTNGSDASGGGIYFFCDKYGPGTSGIAGGWNTPDSYGTEDTTGLMNSYVENCTIPAGSGYLLNIDDNSRVVFRNNTIQDSSIGSHGQESSPYGAREWEIYNNTFRFTSGNPYNIQDVFMIRGGSGVIWGNSMEDIAAGGGYGVGKPGILFCVFSINIPTISCQTAYPAARQVGQGWSASSTAKYGNPVVSDDGTGDVTEGVYIWDNTGAETTDPNFIGLDQPSDQCGDGQLVGNYVQLNRDYFLSAKPGYTPYTYPHPLHAKFALSGGNSTPNVTPPAPQNLRVVN